MLKMSDSYKDTKRTLGYCDNDQRAATHVAHIRTASGHRTNRLHVNVPCLHPVKGGRAAFLLGLPTLSCVTYGAYRRVHDSVVVALEKGSSQFSME